MLRNQLRTTALDAAPAALEHFATTETGGYALTVPTQKAAGLVLAEIMRSGNTSLVDDVSERLLGKETPATPRNASIVFAHAIDYDAAHGGTVRPILLSQLSPDKLQKFTPNDFLPILAAASRTSATGEREINYTFDPVAAIDTVVAEIQASLDDGSIDGEQVAGFIHVLESDAYYESGTKIDALNKLNEVFKSPIMQERTGMGKLGTFFVGDMLDFLKDSPEEFTSFSHNLCTAGFKRYVEQFVYSELHRGTPALLTYFENHLPPEDLDPQRLQSVVDGYAAAGQFDKVKALLDETTIFSEPQEDNEAWYRGVQAAQIAEMAATAGRNDVANKLATDILMIDSAGHGYTREHGMSRVNKLAKTHGFDHAITLAIEHSIDILPDMVSRGMGAEAIRAIIEADVEVMDSISYLEEATRICKKMQFENVDDTGKQRMENLKSAMRDAATSIIERYNILNDYPSRIYQMAEIFGNIGDAMTVTQLVMHAERQEAKRETEKSEDSLDAELEILTIEDICREFGFDVDLTIFPSHQAGQTNAQENPNYRKAENNLLFNMALSGNKDLLRAAYERQIRRQHFPAFEAKQLLHAFLVGALLAGDEEMALALKLDHQDPYAKDYSKPDTGLEDYQWETHLKAAIQQVADTAPAVSTETLQKLTTGNPTYGELLKKPEFLATMLDSEFYRNYHAALL